MKIYSWKTLIVTILAIIYVIIREFEDVMAGEVSAFVFLIFLGYLILKGLWVSFTKEGFEEDKEREKRTKRAYRKLFGSWALIAPWGHLILILLSAASAQFLPSQPWLSIVLIIGSLIYVIVCGGLVRKHMRLEEKGEEL
jgi:amino acid transporter